MSIFALSTPCSAGWPRHRQQLIAALLTINLCFSNYKSFLWCSPNNPVVLYLVTVDASFQVWRSYCRLFPSLVLHVIPYLPGDVLYGRYFLLYTFFIGCLSSSVFRNIILLSFPVESHRMPPFMLKVFVDCNHDPYFPSRQRLNLFDQACFFFKSSVSSIISFSDSSRTSQYAVNMLHVFYTANLISPVSMDLPLTSSCNFCSGLYLYWRAFVFLLQAFVSRFCLSVQILCWFPHMTVPGQDIKLLGNVKQVFIRSCSPFHQTSMLLGLLPAHCQWDTPSSSSYFSIFPKGSFLPLPFLFYVVEQCAFNDTFQATDTKPITPFVIIFKSLYYLIRQMKDLFRLIPSCSLLYYGLPSSHKLTFDDDFLPSVPNKSMYLFPLLCVTVP